MKIKQKCGVCGKRLSISKDEIYMVIESQGFAAALTAPPQKFDAIDCPRCGCQQLLAVRMPRLKKDDPELPKEGEEGE